MRSKLLSTTTFALALTAGGLLMQPVGASAKADADKAKQAQKSDAPKQAKDKIDLTVWTYAPLYAGISAERLFDAEVYDQDGKQIGEVEDMIVTPEGKVRSLVIEAGGFLDIGDTHFAYPIEKAEIINSDAVRVQFDEDKMSEDFSVFRNLEERPVTGRNWKISELIDDYAYLHGHRAYGWVDDVIIGRDGDVRAVVVTADARYGVGGPYAWPYYGYAHGWNPGLDYYEAPYTEDEIAVLGDFDSERMGAQQSADAAAGGQSGASAGTSDQAQILGDPVVDADGKKIGKVERIVGSGDERQVVIALGSPSEEVDKKMLAPRGELEVKGDQVIWKSEAAKAAAEPAAKDKKAKQQ
jgi:sporulation protein YlmC with PRC-barrel domain